MNNTSIVECIDCMIGMKKYPDLFFDLAICDIPYGIDVTKMAYLHNPSLNVKQKNGSALTINKSPLVIGGDWDSVVPGQDYFDELKRVSRNQIVFGIEYTNWQGVGNGRIKWDKGFADGVSFNRFETAYCSLIDYELTIPLLWAGMMQAESLDNPMKQQGNKNKNEKRIHPTHKPVLLYAKLFQLFAKPGMKLLDTHLGGGSHRIAANKMGFDFWAFEINPDIFQAQEIRFQKETHMPLFQSQT